MKNFFEKHKKLILEIFRFLLVGGIATLVDFAFYELFRYVIFTFMNDTMNLVLSTSIGFLCGNIVNYFLSIIFVFKGAKEDKTTQTLKAFLIFTLIGVIGLGIKILVQTSGNYLMNLMFSPSKMFYIWLMDTFVYCVATLIVLIWNYIGRKLFIFKGETK